MQTSRRSLKDTNRSLIQVLVALICTLVVAGCALVSASSEVYSVQPGDTLAKIAWRFKTSIWPIVRANNIANPNVIHVGQRLCIPKPPQPVPPKPRPPKPGCEHLTSPTQGAQLSGLVWAQGTAIIEDFWYYKLEYRKDGLDNWHFITGQHDPIIDGVLGSFDTRIVPDGTYFFRLVIVDRTGNYPPPCEIVVRIEN